MFVITIVQDCDDEDYTDIIKTYNERGLHIRHCMTKCNSGPGVARQTGIDYDQICDYVTFIDADDLVTPRFVEVLYTEAKKNNSDILISHFITEQKHNPGYVIDNSIITWMHGKIYKTSYLREKMIRFLPDMRMNEDAYFNMLAFNFTDNIHQIEEYTYIWRDNSKSITRGDTDKKVLEKGWVDFITGQIAAAIKIHQTTGKFKAQQLASVMRNIYVHCQMADYYGLSSLQANNALTTLFQYEYFNKLINKPNFLSFCVNKSQNWVKQDGQYIFFKENIGEWLDKWKGGLK